MWDYVSGLVWRPIYEYDVAPMIAPNSGSSTGIFSSIEIRNASSLSKTPNSLYNSFQFYKTRCGNLILYFLFFLLTIRSFIPPELCNLCSSVFSYFLSSTVLALCVRIYSRLLQVLVFYLHLFYSTITYAICPLQTLPI